MLHVRFLRIHSFRRQPLRRRTLDKTQGRGVVIRNGRRGHRRRNNPWGNYRIGSNHLNIFLM